jgi:hypothetical protein
MVSGSGVHFKFKLKDQWWYGGCGSVAGRAYMVKKEPEKNMVAVSLTSGAKRFGGLVPWSVGGLFFSTPGVKELCDYSRKRGTRVCSASSIVLMLSCCHGEIGEIDKHG